MLTRVFLSIKVLLIDDEIFRDADLDVDDNLLIGPPPPAMVAEAESANEAERFEEVYQWLLNFVVYEQFPLKSWKH